MTSHTPLEPIIIKPDEAAVTAGPFVMRFLEDGSHTGGSHAVIEFTLNEQFSPPPHIHRQHEEVIYVLEGQFALHLGDEKVVLGPGGAIVTPTGVAHTFSNAGTEPLRFLLTISPAKHLAYFTSMSDFLNGKMEPGVTMVDVMQRYGLEPVQPA